MDHAGAVIGPLLGYVLVWLLVVNSEVPTAREFVTIFLVASVPAILAVLVAIFFMRESEVAKPRRHGTSRNSRCVASMATSKSFY